MADIAMLVAEEYERRVKNSRKAGNHEDGLDSGIDWVSSHVSEIAKNAKNKIAEGNLELPKWVLQPKSQIGLAAADGFFSA